MNNISIIGSGSWAQALTKIIESKRIKIKCRQIPLNKSKFNSKKIDLTTKFEDLTNSNIVFLAIPSQTMRQNLLNLKKVSKNFCINS